MFKLMKPTIKDYQTIPSTMRGCMASFGYMAHEFSAGIFLGCFTALVERTERRSRIYSDTYGVM